MKKLFPQFLSFIFIIFTIAMVGGFIFINTLYDPASAQALKIPEPIIKIPGMDKLTAPHACPPPNENKICVDWLAQYIAGIYKYAIGIIGIFATIVMMFGGLMWITAGGNATKVEDAKAWIGASLTGLVLAMASFTLLSMINPNLTSFNSLAILQVQKTEDTVEDVSSRYFNCQTKSDQKEYECSLNTTLVDPDNCENLPAQHFCCCEIKAFPTCAWQETSVSRCTALAGDYRSDGSGEEQCGTTKPAGKSICCCKNDVPECPSNLVPNFCNPCYNCTQLSVKTKDGKKANRELAAKLANAYEKKKNNTDIPDWWVTEAWPPKIKHDSSRHFNGTCVDINLTNKSTDPAEIKKLYDNLTAAGLNATYEIRSDCAPYVAAGIPVSKCQTRNVDAHFHVK